MRVTTTPLVTATLIGTLACARSAAAPQPSDPQLIAAPVPAAQARELERRAGSEAVVGGPRVSLGADYDPYRGRIAFGQPLIFQRPTAAGELPLRVEYFVSPADSLVWLAMYSWDSRYPPASEADAEREHRRRLDRDCPAYEDAFETLHRRLRARFGAPAVDSAGESVAEPFSRRFARRDASWTRDSTRAELSLICGAGTHRVRVRLHWASGHPAAEGA